MPLELRAPRKGKTPIWTVRGTYLGVHVERSTKTSRNGSPNSSSRSGKVRSNEVNLPRRMSPHF